ncbi:hypothetical protein FGIG_03869 [Fasciola gigantica]|uniref:Uncharacterized protein n=1 Tax=Fasciola gigantica TaxID=46835 RepID=A0A504Z551_FASGI|nr:hypothetical protein FGIG_03869 [Fasciola gigantica]
MRSSCYSEALGHVISTVLRTPAYLSISATTGNHSSQSSLMESVLRSLKGYPLPRSLRYWLWPSVLVSEMSRREVWPYQATLTDDIGRQRGRSIEKQVASLREKFGQFIAHGVAEMGLNSPQRCPIYYLIQSSVTKRAQQDDTDDSPNQSEFEQRKLAHVYEVVADWLEKVSIYRTSIQHNVQ